MAVLFPTSSGSLLRADRPDQLLQGFLNIEQAENVTNGKLTQANLDSYAQKRFFAVDPNSNISSYLKTNFATIADNDGDATSISSTDLVQLRSDLPAPPAVVNPPNPYPGPFPNQDMMSLVFKIFQSLMQVFQSFFK